MSTQVPETTANGTAPAPVDPLARIIGDLEEQLAPLSARRSQLESEVADVIAQEQRIKAGIAALSTGPKRKTAAKTDSSSHWTPSQKTLDDVYAALAKGPSEGMTLADLEGVVDVTRGTVSKAIDALRGQERVRLMGQAARPGAPKLFGVMP